MDVKIESSWKEALIDEFNKEYFQKLAEYIRQKYKETVVYPPANKIFEAFNACPFYKVKVVILGQDPYHGPNQAHGLSFSVEKGQPKPPSLLNIYKELQNDLGIKPPEHGDLTHWAEQGVFLLNAILTVEGAKPASHQNIGWEYFTNAVIKTISDKKEHVVFILWGSYAQKKRNSSTHKSIVLLHHRIPHHYRQAEDFSDRSRLVKVINISENTIWMRYNGRVLLTKCANL